MSDFSPGHRFSLFGSYRIPAGPAGITLAAYYDAQQGRPYSYLDGSDSNRDGTRGNDLLYVPRGAADVIVTDGAFDDLMRFLSAGCDVTPGTILPRNACRGPWTYTLDFHLGVDFPRGPSELELFIDIRNLINAFDARNGLAEFAFFQNLQPVRSSVDPATGRYVYSLNSPARPGPGSRATASPATTCGAGGRRSWGCATRSGGSAGRADAEPARKPSPAAPIANDVPHLRPSAQHDPDLAPTSCILAPTHLALLRRDVPNRAHVTAQPTASRNGSTNRYTVCAGPSTATAYSA